jgi:hypothetical protein
MLKEISPKRADNDVPAVKVVKDKMLELLKNNPKSLRM